MAKCLRCGAGPEWLELKAKPELPKPDATVRPLIMELAAAQNDLSKAVALGPEFKGYVKKFQAASLRQAKAIIALCDLVRGSAPSSGNHAEK